MGYALIWIESLATELLLVALVAAVAARWRFGAKAVPTLVAVTLVAVAVASTVGVCVLHAGFDNHPISNPQSIASIAWTLAFVIGSLVLLLNGLRGPEPAARTWSRSKLALAFGGLVALTAITLSNMDLAVKVQLSAVRAEAGARTLASLPPRVPDADNAAPIYYEAFEYLPDPERVPPLFREKSAGAWREYDRSAFDPKDKDLREFLRANERALALVRKAAAMPGCTFEHDFSQGMSMLVPEVTRLPHAATLLAYDALVKATDGDARGALADVAAIYGIAGHVTEPFLIGVKASATVETTAARVLQDVVNMTTVLAGDLDGLRLADAVSYRRAVRRGLITEEAAFGLATIAGLAAGDPDLVRAAESVFSAANVALLASPVYRVFFLEEDLAAYRRVMKDIERLTERPYYEARPDWEALDKSWEQGHRRGILTSMLAPSMQRLVVIATEADAERAMVRTAVALAAAKAKAGAYPETLDALVPEYLPRIPADPFSGRPLKLKRDGDGVVVYSVGRNLKDDGGRPAQPATDGDLVFRLR